MAFPCSHCKAVDPCACPTVMPPGIWVDMRKLHSFRANGRLGVADMVVMNGVEFRRLTKEIYDLIRTRVTKMWPEMNSVQRANVKEKVKPIREWAVERGW